MCSNNKHTDQELKRYILLYIEEGKRYKELNICYLIC